MFGLFKKKNKKLSREQLQAQAMENARLARERIGEENIQKMAAILHEQNKTAGARARDEIRKMDDGVVADHLKIILKD